MFTTGPAFFPPLSSATDPLFASVVSLLHFDGTNGSTTITDQIPARIWTAAGGAVIDTSVAKFGPSSLNNNAGSIATPSSSAFAFGTGDFTVEGFIYLTNTPINSDTYIVDIGTNGIVLQFVSSGATTGKIGAYTSATGISGALYTSGLSVSKNTWTHFALCRASGVITGYLGGVAWGSQASTQNFNASVIPHYGAYGGGGYNLAGWLDECRITAAARYSGNFTPPSAPFPNHA